MRKLAIYILLLIFYTSCGSYYHKHLQFNQHFQKGNLEEADKILAADKKAEKRKDKLLYYMNRGVVHSIIGNYEQSNAFFEQAYYLIEDYQKNYFNIAASFLTNPDMVDYRGEDHEKLFIHYYKAINYLKMNDKEKALVECRRMDIRLHQISDRYKSPHKFKKDAFIHTLMGIIYDANGDYNNAFIAYRNAVGIYQQEYAPLFGFSVPGQLKKDLLRTAYLTGFQDELRQYEKLFDMRYVHDEGSTGDLVFFWNNGLGPVKTEWGLTFTIIRGEGGLVTFHNEGLGLSFPFFLADNEEEDKLSDLEFIRVVFPKYVERPLVFTSARLKANNRLYPLDKLEDVNAIAFKSLEQRMLLEMSKSLLRVAVKKGIEYSLRKENEQLGAALGVINAITEKADTRNWQSLPHSIYYTRLSLPEGEHKVAFETHTGKGEVKQDHILTIDIRPGITQFHTFHSLETTYQADFSYGIRYQ